MPVAGWATAGEVRVVGSLMGVVVVAAFGVAAFGVVGAVSGFGAGWPGTGIVGGGLIAGTGVLIGATWG